MICLCGYACEDWEGEKEFNKEYACPECNTIQLRD